MLKGFTHCPDFVSDPQFRPHYDIDLLFQNPREGAKYEIRYGVRVDPGTPRPVIWEKAGREGRRYIALSMGYVVLRDEKEFSELRR